MESVKIQTPPRTLTVPLQSLNTSDNISAPTFRRESRRFLNSLSVDSNFFYKSIHGHDIDLGSATQWARTVLGPRNGANWRIFRPR